MEYSKSFQVHFNDFRKLFETVSSQRSVNFENNEISQAILLRMKSYYTYQNQIKHLLNKRYITPASDFFVETILFYLMVCLKLCKSSLQVRSEKQIGGKGTPRPDMSIWDNGKLVSAIECKTQLGWNRYGWKQDYKKRTAKIKRLFPDATCYLIVMTSQNWPGFGQDPNVGRKFFCLCKVWPTQIDDKRIDDYLLNPIDQIILSFVERVRTH
jgi:type I site-specific restriction-modification system R (restriction) subunit